ncbi:uncharacterized protein DUF2628 [Acinetobacter calcoaceticus]|uniref:Uncharacterized protein DUF2628 n=1 Tax=Acinetobacter calcoaceticus TaxID=471 RepID=A0A4R1Y109_ACICA|nr:uncharacterized protein DUF2628 [Acinetobacter calcoaceticus]
MTQSDPNSGAPFQPTAQRNPDYADNIQVHDRAVFVGEQYRAYYHEKFSEITAQKKTSGFNIAAFFLGILWLFYRKMYFYGCLGIVFMIMMGVLQEFVGYSGAGLNIAMSAVFGVYANTIYKYFVDQKIIKIQNTTSDEEKRKQLQQQGGTSWLAVGGVLGVLGIVIFMILNI